MVTAERPKLKSRAVYEGYTRAPARAYLRAMGLTDEDIAKPFVGVVSAWNETSPCNVHLNRFAGLAKEGVKAAGGTPREFTTIAVTEGIACQPRGDRRLNRADDARPRLRRARWHRRLRQDAPRDHDGDGPAERPVRLHVRRKHPSGSLRRPRRYHPGRLRERRRSRGRPNDRRTAARTRVRRLPGRRRLRRYVHRQHDGLRQRGPRPRAPLHRLDPRGRARAYRSFA